MDLKANKGRKDEKSREYFMGAQGFVDFNLRKSLSPEKKAQKMKKTNDKRT